jgi:DNA polymerase-4
MDAFYASVEQRDNPELRGKPVAVGWEAKRGVVTTASYEARKFGVRSAMPSVTAKRLCPHLIFVPPRFEVYHQVSEQIRGIFHQYTDLVEPLSLDEAYLDVTENKKNIPSATLIAREIKEKIRESTGLTASAGISVNKFLAKIASDIGKPDGLYLIPPDKAVEFVEKLPIEKFFGVGKVTAARMHEMGIRTGFDLKQFTEDELVRQFGKTGRYYYQIARAEDPREVEPNRIMKSLGAENTFPEDIDEMERILRELETLLDIVWERMEKSGTQGKTLTMKVKYADFHTVTRSKTMSDWIKGRDQTREIYMDLLKSIDITGGIRLLGLSFSHLNHEVTEEAPGRAGDSQLSLDL